LFITTFGIKPLMLWV